MHVMELPLQLCLQLLCSPVCNYCASNLDPGTKLYPTFKKITKLLFGVCVWLHIHFKQFYWTLSKNDKVEQRYVLEQK